ncbi:PIR protein [Plasmodium vivax]|uniref:VIR protein n=1 Tax=Plasmodium vivax TaxID=5855 RepID=A0A565A3Q9_PLAVI|nr:PIR protein [Plasmodium vivax]
MYYKFAEPLNAEYNNQESSACNRVKIYEGDNVEEHKNTCKAILRNSFSLYNENNANEVLLNYCNILYIWLYFEIEKNKLIAKIINKIFQETITGIQQKNLKKFFCPYFSYNENLREPEKLMKLRIFNDNIETIKNILNNIDALNKCSCLEYVYECINIYKDMNRDYCSGEKNKDPKNSDTCNIVDEFRTKYNLYIYKIKNEIYKLPYLSDINDMSKVRSTHIAHCSLDGKRQNSNYNNGNQSESYTQSNVTKVLGTMIGISSFLALSYKYTPLRRIFNFRNNTQTVRNGLNEEKANELYKESDTWNSNSNDPRYNIGYGSV